MTERWFLTPRACKQASSGDELGVLVDSYNAGMFLCNEVAWELLNILGDGADLAELTDRLTSRFDISKPVAQRDALAFLHQLKRMGLADVQA